MKDSLTEQVLPADLREALEATPGAVPAWQALTDIGRRDFLSWIATAKQEATRQKRIGRACENLVKGKKRPCCYAVVPMDLYKALGADPVAKSQWSNLSADEKRDFSDWIEDSKDKQIRKNRVESACALIIAGERAPKEAI